MTIREWFSRLRGTLLGGRSDRDLEQELRAHLDFAAEAERRRGRPESSAGRAAALRAGAVAQAMESQRDQRGFSWLIDAVGDVRFAARALRRTPGFTVIAIGTLALGIGATTAVFSLFNTVLLRPLGYGDEQRLVAVHEIVRRSVQAAPQVPVNALHFQEWRRTLRAVESIALIGGVSFDLTGRGEPERLSAARVSPSLFPMLGARMQLGRTFLNEEDQPGHDNVVILSNQLWRRRFGSDPGIIGRAIVLGGRPYEVIGVLSAAFHFPELRHLYAADIAGDSPELWKPFGARPEELGLMGDFSYACIARLRPGVSLSAALAEWNAAQAHIADQAAERVELHAALVSLHEQIAGRARRGLQLLMAAVAIVLLIGTVNIANLLTVRTTSRRREIAIRSAMGARPQRLVRQMLTEGLLIACTGGAAGIVVGFGALRVLVTRAPLDLPRLDEVHLDLRVLLFTVTISLVVGLFFGLLPAFRVARASPQSAMSSSSRGNTESTGARRLRSVLVAVEVGLCTLCLMAGGLFLRSFNRLMGADKGFAIDHVITVNLSLPGLRYPGDADRVRFFRSVLAVIQPLPGVIAVGVADMLPLSGEGGNNVLTLEGTVVPFGQRPLADIRGVNPEYFAALGISVRSGRVFSESDRDHRLAVVSALTADRLWPNQDPLGKRFRIGDPGSPAIEVAGVVSDVRSVSLDKPASFTVYVPYWQRRTWYGPALAVRTASAPEANISAIRAAIRTLDPELPIPTFRTLEHVVDDSVAQRRFQRNMTLIFAMTALVMASLGIYGVVSYSVALRTTEMGIRMAFGARATTIMGMTLRQGLLPVVAGLAAGLVASFAAGGLLAGMLYGIVATDPVTTSAVVLVLVVVGAVASFMPARRATRVDPLTALRRG